jgi:hypothetical protein
LDITTLKLSVSRSFRKEVAAHPEPKIARVFFSGSNSYCSGGYLAVITSILI